MATPVHWANAVSGDFADGANWVGGAAPGSGDDADLDAAGAAYAVTSSADETVAGLGIAANATLALTGGDFTALNGTDGAASAGLISIGGHASLTVGGAFVNSGAITLAGGAGPSRLMIGSASDNQVILSGGGSVTLGGAGDRIGPAQGAFGQLFNVDNTISGAGRIGGRFFGLDNEAAGVVAASGPGALMIRAGEGVDNFGKLEATGGAALVFDHTIVGNLGAGWILADTDSTVVLRHATIVGGVLASEPGGRIEAIGRGNALGGGAAPITVNADLVVGGGDTLAISGEIDLLYRIALTGHPSAGARRLVVGTSGATLTGGGRIVLGAAGMSQILGERPEDGGQGGGAILVNASAVIAGAGRIGGGGLILVNGNGGTITANLRSPLVVDTGANTVINAGRLRAAGQGVLVVESRLDNSGQIDVSQGGALTLAASVTGHGVAGIMGGTLTFQSSFDQNVYFTRGDAFGGELVLARSQAYGAAISGFAGGGATSLDLEDIAFVSSGEATYAGNAKGGVLTVTDGGHTAEIHLVGDYLGATFLAASDGAGGTLITDTSAAARFTGAMARLGASAHAAAQTHLPSAPGPGERLLAAPCSYA